MNRRDSSNLMNDLNFFLKRPCVIIYQHTSSMNIMTIDEISPFQFKFEIYWKRRTTSCFLQEKDTSANLRVGL